MKTLRLALLVAVFLVTLLAFLPALHGQFVNWDDDRNFVDNPGFRGLGWPQLKWMWTTTLMGHYIPLTWMSLGLNYTLGGMNPWGYHLGSMLIHAANAALVYFVARRLLAAAGIAEGAPLLWAAAFAALVFGIHPLRVESVAWATERRDVLCGFFFLLAVLSYLRSAEPGAPGRWRAASLAAFAAALLSKAQAMPLPVALLILDVYPLRRVRELGWRRVLIEKLPYALLSLAGAVLALDVDPLAPRFLLPMVALVAVTVLLVALRRRWPGLLAAWLYSALMVLPVVGPVHAGHQLANDRYSYLSGLGFAVLAGAALGWALRASQRGLLSPLAVRLCGLGAVLSLLGFASATWVQAGGWKDSETLWAWAVELDPDCAACHSNLGEAIGRERPREAEAAFLQSLSLRDRPITRSNLGAVLELQGRLDEALRQYEQALDRDPGLVEALANLGSLHARVGRDEQALPLLRRAFRVAPEFPELRANLGGALRRRGIQLEGEGRAAEARLLFEESLRVAPGDTETLRLLRASTQGRTR